MANSPFKDKLVWLTGASTGIGYQLLNELLKQQAMVVACARNIDSLNELQATYPEHLLPVSLDVTDKQAIAELMSTIEARYQRIDVALLNAGTCLYMDMPDFTSDTIQKNFDVNFFGMVYCIEAALPLLKKAQKPYIVGMASSAAFVGLPRAEGYGSSKAAVRYLLQTLQVTLAPEKIDVSIICPGFVKTPLTDRNDFPMPFLISPEKATRYILQGMKHRKPEISFPWLFMTQLKLISRLPDRLRIWLLKKLIQ